MPPADIACPRRPVEVWLTHILIGDAIPTNVAAAKQVWTAVTHHLDVGEGVVTTRYFLAVMKCGVHQTALTAKYGIIGEAAATVTPATGGVKWHEQITYITRPN